MLLRYDSKTNLVIDEKFEKGYSGRNKRLYKEFRSLKEFIGFQVFGLFEDYSLHGVLEGPPETAFENGFFHFLIKFPQEYPFKPPEFFFKTKIFHPNIDEFGYVSINILKNDWSLSLTTNLIILSIQSLLDDPNPDDFINEKAAKLYKENKSEYEKTVRRYTSEFANFDIVQNDLKAFNFKIDLGNNWYKKI